MRFRELFENNKLVEAEVLSKYEYNGYQIMVGKSETGPVGTAWTDPENLVQGEIRFPSKFVAITKDRVPVRKIFPPAGEQWSESRLQKEAEKQIDTDIKPEEVERARQDQEERERQRQDRQLGNRTDRKRKRSSSVIFNVKLLEALETIPEFGAIYEEDGRLYLLVSDDNDDKETFNMQKIYDRNIRQEEKLPRPIFALTGQMISQAPSIAERSRYTVDVNDRYTGKLADYPISYHSEVERGSKDKTSRAEFLNDPGITISSVMQESATAGATSAGSVASVANPPTARAKIKRDKKGVPKAPQKTNPDGTAKNALDVDNNLMGGKTVKR